MVPFAVIALLTLWQSTTATSPDSLLADIQLVASADSNEGRFDALTTLLRARKLVFDVETFTIDTPRGREPRVEGRNVVVTLGDGPDEVVVGAHYDAVRLPDGTLSRGAVDNAASAVMLVRLAEALRIEKLPVRLRVVWFDMEELGLIGSAKYITNKTASHIRAMLNFDINAYGDTILFGPSQRERNAGLQRLLVQTCAIEGRDCVPFPQMPPGDDRSFAGADIPTLSIALLPAIEVHQLWLRLNARQDSALLPDHAPPILRTIHTAEDTAAKVDAASVDGMLRFALTLVRTVVAQ